MRLHSGGESTDNENTAFHGRIPVTASDLMDRLGVAFAALSALASCAAAVVSCSSLQDVRTSTTASLRATVIASVDEAMKLASRDSTYAPNLILTLRNAAEMQRAGIISADDASAIIDYLQHSQGVAHEKHACDAWAGWKSRNSPQVTKQLQQLINAAIDPPNCKA
jgi:hypothetical protein